MINKKIFQTLTIGLLSIPFTSLPILTIASCNRVVNSFLQPTEEELYKNANNGVATYTLRLKNKKTKGSFSIDFISHTDNVIVKSPTNDFPIIDPSTQSQVKFNVCFDYIEAPNSNDWTQDVYFSCIFKSLDENGNIEWDQTIDNFYCLWDKKPWPRDVFLWGQNIVFADHLGNDAVAFNLSQSWRDVSWKLTDLSDKEVDFVEIQESGWNHCTYLVKPDVPIGTQFKLSIDVNDLSKHLEHIVTIGLKGPSKYHRLSCAKLVEIDKKQYWQIKISGFTGHISPEVINSLKITATSLGLPYSLKCSLEREQLPNDEQEQYAIIVNCPKESGLKLQDFWFNLSIKKDDIELLSSPNPYRFSFPMEATETDDPSHPLIISQPYLWSKDDSQWWQQIVSDPIDTNEIDTGRILISTNVTNLTTGEQYETTDSHFDNTYDKFVWDTSDFLKNSGARDTRSCFKIETEIKYYLKNDETEYYKKFVLNYIPPFEDVRPVNDTILLDLRHNESGQCTVCGKTKLIVDTNTIPFTDSSTVDNIYLYPEEDDSPLSNEEIEGYIYGDGLDKGNWYFDIQREYIVDEIDLSKKYYIDIMALCGSYNIEMWHIPVTFNPIN